MATTMGPGIPVDPNKTRNLLEEPADACSALTWLRTRRRRADLPGTRVRRSLTTATDRRSSPRPR